MTDEEKAEEYLKENRITSNENWEVGGKYCYTLCKQAYLAGLAEGRKELEKENKIQEEIIIGEQIEIDRLNKENAGLKAQIKELQKCEDCKHCYDFGPCGMNCHNKDKWEKAE